VLYHVLPVMYLTEQKRLVHCTCQPVA